MRKGALFIFLFCVLFSMPAQSQKTDIWGNNKTYKGIHLNVYTCTDYISGTNTLIGSTVADESGNFNIELNIDQTCQIIVDLGANQGLLFVEPGKKYQVKIPDYVPLNMGNRLNPYFKPSDFQLGIIHPGKTISTF